MYTFPVTLLRDIAMEPCSVDGSVNVIRTEMDNGRIRQRQRFTTDLRYFKVVWTLTDAQFAIFAAWVKYRLNFGNDYFNVGLPMGDMSAAMGGAATRLTTVSARLVGGKYSETFNQGWWQVSAVLEVETVPTLTEGNLTTLGC